MPLDKSADGGALLLVLQEILGDKGTACLLPDHRQSQHGGSSVGAATPGPRRQRIADGPAKGPSHQQQHSEDTSEVTSSGPQGQTAEGGSSEPAGQRRQTAKPDQQQRQQQRIPAATPVDRQQRQQQRAPAAEKSSQPQHGRDATAASRRGGSRRSEVIRVIPTGGHTYFEVLGAVRNDPVLQDAAESLRSPRRMAGDVLMLRCRRGDDVNAIVSGINAAVGHLTTVRVTTSMATVVVSNLDGVTTDEELQRAVLQQHGAVVDKANIRLRLYRNGLKRARIRIAAREAAKIVGKRLKLGLSVVTPYEEQRAPAEEDRCYRCMEKGHRSRQCRGMDRSHCCFRCGSEGHQAFGCRSPPRCLVCGRGQQTGSPKCTFDATEAVEAATEVAASSVTTAATT
uniref:CCHC-type domain-containing protein n=1 Tax=Anopheles dirus TaxID=7168 RepID=A0A182N9Y3_9DIPT